MSSQILETQSGKIQGTFEKNVFVWKGIPYAQPPLGALRFRTARPVRPWKGVLAAHRFGPASMQRKKYRAMGEDCLYLNIWSPAADGKRRPVLFFIHGGSFCAGAGSDPEYNGAALALSGDVVVVTVNYRLGVLGFLDFSFLGEEFSPNCGLTDIVAALKWVHANIEAFGGDPQNITVLGQSAGAIAASVLPVMPSAREYVSKVIMMSGGPSLLYTKQRYQEVARQFLSFMQVSTPEELRALPAGRIAAAQKKFASWCGLGEATFMIETDGDLVPGYPIPAAAHGAARDIPILIGTTKEEVSFLCNKVLSRVMDIKNILASSLGLEKAETRRNIENAYRRYGKRARSMMLADRVFRMSSVWYAEAYNQYARTWMYRFDYETPAMRAVALRACHSTDIPFVFGNFSAGPHKWMFLLPAPKTCRRIRGEIQGDFLQFMKTGTLPWRECRGVDTPAKCYNEQSSVHPMVEPEIEREYEKSEFRRMSWKGLDYIGANPR